jgi:hypothetical protein
MSAAAAAAAAGVSIDLPGKATAPGGRRVGAAAAATGAGASVFFSSSPSFFSTGLAAERNGKMQKQLDKKKREING